VILKLSSIGNHVEKVSTWNPSQSSILDTFKYIDLSSVDKDKKVISLQDVPLINPIEAPSRARQLVKANDVLVATVRPNLNGVAVVPDELDGATASTGYCVLRADNHTLDFRYLYHWVKMDSFVKDMMNKATGASYPAVSDKIIKESKIPLPSLNEQKRIAAILDKADSLRRKRQQAIQLADEFLRAVFLDLFGDPVTNPKGWETVPVSHFVNEFQGGKSLVEKGDDDFKSKYRVLKISAVTWKTFNPAESKPLPDNYEPNTEHFVKKHDLLFSRANTTELVGATSYVFETPDNLLLPDKIWRFVWKNEIEVSPLFIWHLFWDSGIRYQLGNLATGSGGSMKNISKSKLMQFKVIFPPYELQKKFALKLERIMELQRKMAEKNEYNLLFNSLSQKAFAGEL
jgi:type I restriction enzyme S subunit